MKVANTGISGASAPRRRARPHRAESGDFSASLTQAPAAAGSAPVAPSGALGGLLSIQEISDEPDRRRRARARGELLLSQLEALRVALLDGVIPREKLNSLLAAVRSSQEEVSDPRLREILAEIELRAAVELAKLGQNF